MTERDEYDDLIEKRFPCDCNKRDGHGGHFSSCVGYWWDEISDLLREAGKREAELRREVESWCRMCQLAEATVYDKDDEIAELKAKLAKYQSE